MTQMKLAWGMALALLIPACRPASAAQPARKLTASENATIAKLKQEVSRLREQLADVANRAAAQSSKAEKAQADAEARATDLRAETTRLRDFLTRLKSKVKSDKADRAVDAMLAKFKLADSLRKENADLRRRLKRLADRAIAKDIKLNRQEQTIKELRQDLAIEKGKRLPRSTSPRRVVAAALPVAPVARIVAAPTPTLKAVSEFTVKKISDDKEIVSVSAGSDEGVRT